MVEPAPGENRQEQRREYDPTFIKEDDPEYLEEIENDQFSPFLNGEKEPKVKITTSGDEEPSIPFGKSLQVLIPNSLFENRKEGSSMAEVRNQAIEEGYTDLIILTSANNQVYTFTHHHLPDGPTANYRITSISLPKEIEGHARTSDHYPEVLMKRFETRLGRLTSRMLQCLFPHKPNFFGRRVLTFHHQRDFIFFRHYRYIFDSVNEARLQECGPRFTLKLLWLQEGTFDPSNGQYTYFRRARHDRNRLAWPL
ncbi:Brix-domain-containing protein [Histomonas meleagridis]|uniref:Brix-domain-containing protein n=1 Tax=Histomonas meleagridis TaxID=135588 RepID=UPI003559B968|nr:Brix-domain-containing protein [Histomonas meleagridis]KAH0799790.1 Brix-domain-containing protein [Histomonas meleagridis]